MIPGCKNDCALILEGPQGLKKSTALRVLGEPWFTDDIADIGSKDAQLQIRGAWIIEWSDLDAMSRVDISKVKAFMSRAIDRFRPPYGHRLVELPRESVFAGTTNSDSYLRDVTGARRFWPVRCGVIDIDSLKQDRDQLWAEAVVRFRDGASWWLEKQFLVEAAEMEQAERYEGVSGTTLSVTGWRAASPSRSRKCWVDASRRRQNHGLMLIKFRWGGPCARSNGSVSIRVRARSGSGGSGRCVHLHALRLER
jgi:predicted P-loop ATPase